jgi:hypothetical protein
VPPALAFAVLTVLPCTARADSPACDRRCDQILESCSLDDLGCVARNVTRLPQVAACNLAEADCEGRLGLYRLYMQRVARDVALYPLPRAYVQVLDPYYPSVRLNRVRIGFSGRQPDYNATTDCTKIYFNDPEIVGQIVNGALTVGISRRRPDPDRTRLDWLLHELRHVEQCQEWGGRDHYALRWMEDVTGAMLKSMTLRHEVIHANQAMEKDADRVAAWVLARLTHNVDAHRRLVPVIRIYDVRRSTYPEVGGDPVVITVRVGGGSEPLSFSWGIRRPGSRRFTAIPRSEGSALGPIFSWTPRRSGAYQIRVRVFQRRSYLRPKSRVLRVVALPSIPPIYKRVTGVVRLLIKPRALLSVLNGG